MGHARVWLVLLLAVVVAACAREAKPRRAGEQQANLPLVPQVGQPAPQMAGLDLDGKPFQLSDYRGKVVMLDFWMTNWGPCRRMMPHEQLLVKRLANQPFAMIGVATDQDRRLPTGLVRQERLNWRNVWDQGLQICERYGVEGMPTVFILDRQGVIRFHEVGYVEGRVLDRVIDDLLREKGSG